LTHYELCYSLLAFLVLVEALAFRLVEASYDHEEVRFVQGAFVAVEAYSHFDTYAVEADLVFQMAEVEFDFAAAAAVLGDTVVAVVVHSGVVGIAAAVAEGHSFVVLDHSLVAEDLDCTEAVLALRMDFQHLHKDCRHTGHNFVLCLDHNLARRSLAGSCYSMVMVEDSLLAQIHCSIDCFAVDAAWLDVDGMPYLNAISYMSEW